MRRTLRIFPLYYAGLIFGLLILPHFSPTQARYVKGIGSAQVYLWTYTMNLPRTFGQTLDYSGFWNYWTLAVEEQFYLVWPAVVLLVRPRTLIKVCIGVIIAATLLRAGLLLRGHDRLAIYHFTLTRMDCLAMGALIAAFISLYGRPEWLARAARWTAAVSFIGLLVIGIAKSGLYTTIAATQLFGYTLLMLFWSSLLVLALDAAGPFARFLDFKALRSIGRYSYGIYVCHVMVMTVLIFDADRRERLASALHSRFLAALVMLVVGSALSYGVGWFVWHAFEKHFLALKRYFPSGRDRKIRSG
jgi:peptidoglycan/LPS O-acetylase OafA/YrhL